MSHVYWGDVEHIRPRSKFPDLEFEWMNLGYVCARCNSSKADKWSAATPFIDPFVDDPDEHFAAVGQFVFHRNGSERGEYTWLEIGLNRPDLIERRLERIQLIRSLIDKSNRTRDEELKKLVLQELQIELGDEKEYAMVCRAAFRVLGPGPTAS